MARFYWDFFGMPIQELGHKPKSIKAQAPYLELLISEEDLMDIFWTDGENSGELNQHY